MFEWKSGLWGDKPIPPIPKTIKYRYSKTVGNKYWANTCSYCNSLQGDFFLKCEPGGPFTFNVQRDDDTWETIQIRTAVVPYYL